MADNFTSDHVKLLNTWQGQKRDEADPVRLSSGRIRS